VLDDRYRLVRLLGEGGMGAVYLGRHLKLGRDVAVKLLHAELAGNEEVVTRFYREAQTAAAIRHRNIIDVLDVGTAAWGDPYLVMEYLEGENLADLLARSGPLDLATACGVLEPVLLALGAAHEIGVVHRDLKPENVFISHQKGEPPTVKLIDFGISRFVGGADKTRLTQTGSMLGTPAYMSPEQARGQTDVDHLTDVSYEVRAAFPRVAEATVTRALAKDADIRFQTAAEMLAAIASFPGYEQRAASMGRLSAPRNDLGCATGDLGYATTVGTPSAWTPPTAAGEVRRRRGPARPGADRA
jgi:serine/threonine-protein kinase